MKRFLILLLGLVGVAEAQPTTEVSKMYIESGVHCSEGTLNEQVDVKVFMDAPSTGISIWRCGLDYFESMWHVTGATMGPAMDAVGGFFIFNPDPVGLLPTTGSDVFLLFGMTPLSTPMYGNNLHVATIHMTRENYPQPTGPTPISFNGHFGNTDWTDDVGRGPWGYGFPNTVLLNGCWKLKDNSCGYMGNCPTGSYTPCPKCPPEVEEKVAGPDTPVQPKTWQKMKELYR